MNNLSVNNQRSKCLETTQEVNHIQIFPLYDLPIEYDFLISNIN